MVKQAKFDDINQKLLNAINIQGVLFQDKCLNTFSEKGWQVVSEYPVIFPKPAFGNLGKEGVIDIWAKKQLTKLEMNLFVECKKADPKLKNWIFFVDKYEQATGTDTIDFSKNDEGKWTTKTFLQDMRGPFKKMLTLKDSVCFFGLEVKEEFKKGRQKDDTKSSTARILDAAYQATQATNGTFQESGEYFSKLQDSELDKSEKLLMFVPIVVTTANLMVSKFSAEHIDDLGAISDIKNIEFSHRDLVLYCYPVPGHIRFPLLVADVPKLSLEKRLGFKKTLVLIVNFKYLSKFLEKLK